MRGKGNSRHRTRKEIGRPEESTNRRKGEGSRWLRKETCGNWGKGSNWQGEAECQICKGSGGHWGFGWDVSQLLFTKISHQ